MPSKWSLQKKMTWLLVVFGVIPLCLMGVLMASIRWNAHVSEEISQNEYVLDNIEADYLMLMSQTENVIRTLANVQALPELLSIRSVGDWIALYKEAVLPELTKAEVYLSSQDAKIMLLYESDVFFLEHWYRLLKASRFSNSSGYQDFLASGAMSGWYGMSQTLPEPLSGVYDFQSMGERFTYYCRIASSMNHGSGVIKCAVSCTPYLEAARQRVGGKALYILSGGRVLYASDEAYAPELPGAERGNDGTVRWGGSLWQQMHMDGMELDVMVRSDIHTLFLGYLKSNGGLLLLVFLTIFLLFFVAQWVLGSLLERFKRITAVADSINAKDGRVHLPEDGEDEVGHMVRAFNSLFDRIDYQMEEMMGKEKAKRHMQALALQYQLNPHFLFNSLLWLQMELENRNVDRAVCGNITKLGSVLRYNLSESLEATLAQEAEHLQAYIDFMSDMKKQKITLELDWEPELNQVVIPRFMLQPLVENALQHGLIYGVDMRVSVRVEQDGDIVRFRIANNGRAIVPARLEQIRMSLAHPECSDSGRVGITNLAQRLKLKYPDRHQIQVSSEPGETVFIIEIPVETSQKKE